MKHVFIINPRAGKKNSTAQLMDQIESLRRKHGIRCETLLTCRAGHGEEIAGRIAESGEEVRIYACGGDGTFNEVVNGAAGAPNVEVTVVPIGTGNDFIKNFGADAPRFLELEQLWDAPSHPLDMIECNGRVAMTIVCVGLDARVADDVHKYSKYPGVTGKGAYLASLGMNFCKGITNHLMIRCDERTTLGEYALLCVCNGRYYGGGFMPVAEARMDDGILDTLIVRKVSRATFLKLVPAYAKGNARNYPKIAQHLRSRRIEFHGQEKLAISLDGEIMHAQDAVISLSPYQLRFFAPEGASCNSTARPLIELPREKRK